MARRQLRHPGNSDEQKLRGSGLVEKLLAKRQGNSDAAQELQCGLTASERLECGSFGVDRSQCEQRECCFLETDEVDVPWCFHSAATVTSECSAVAEESRIECGSYGIKLTGCQRLGCCWRPTSTAQIPWCYHAAQAVNQSSPVETNLVDLIAHELPAAIVLPAAAAPPAAPTVPGCGVPAIAPNVNMRVVGGVEATPHSWPWMVSLQRDGNHFCGGSLINPQWVLSAAHCSPGFSSLTVNEVVVGLHKRSTPDHETVRVKVVGIFPNEKYLRNPRDKMSNDVMLLKLEHPVTFTDGVSPICLPSAFKKIPAGRRCYSTGWGHLEEGGTSPDQLMQVMLPVIDNAQCNVADWYDGKIDDTMVCAGFAEGGYDTCQGDSGGPFVCYDEDRWILYGVVSWGFGCAGARHPGLYGRTSPYLKWINKTMSANSSD